MPISDAPASCMIVRTSAKSRLISPGTVIRSVMPWTPWRRTSSAIRKASMIDVRRSTTSIRRSFGMTITESTCFCSSSMPSSARRVRWAPSNVNGRVTTPTVSAPCSRAIWAMTGARAGAGAAALAGGDEDHVRAADGLLQLLAALLGGVATHPRVGAGAEALGDRAADVDLDVGVAHRQRLRVGVDGDELHAADARVDHPVDGVGAAAADAHDLDDRQVVARLHRISPDRHCSCGDSGRPQPGVEAGERHFRRVVTWLRHGSTSLETRSALHGAVKHISCVSRGFVTSRT